MRLSKVISTLKRRRDWCASKIAVIDDAESPSHHWINQEKVAIEHAIEMLINELARRKGEVVD